MINLADDFQPLGWDRQLQIGVDHANFENAPEVLAIKPLISQTFSNIIENAVKYSDSDTAIRITGSHDAKANTVTVNIKSRGIPLPADVLSVFERGFRSTEAQNKYPAGTGFGLYIAKRIVEIHEGTITASMQDRDAIFSVTLSVRGLEGKARMRDAKDRSSR